MHNCVVILSEIFVYYKQIINSLRQLGVGPLPKRAIMGSKSSYGKCFISFSSFGEVIIVVNTADEST